MLVKTVAKSRHMTVGWLLCLPKVGGGEGYFMRHQTIHRTTAQGSLRPFRLHLSGISVWLVTISLLVLGCNKKTETQALDAVAWVGGRPVLTPALESEMKRQSMGGLAADKEKILGELVELEAAYGKAITSGFIERPEVQRAIRLLVAERLRASIPSEITVESGKIAEERARALYAANPRRFLKAESWNAAWIRLETPRKATAEKKAEVLQRALSLKGRAEKECRLLTHFGPLAASVSADQSTRYRGGELGWMTLAQMEARMDPLVVAALRQLEKPGVVSEPVVAADGVYLIKLMARRPEELRPFDEVRPQLDHEMAQRVRQERETRWSRWCLDGVEVRVEAERLAQVVEPAPATNNPAPPAPMTVPQ